MQRPHVFDYLRTKHHYYYTEEARDNQTIKQQVDTCALVAVLKAVAQIVVIVIVDLITYISFVSSLILLSICMSMVNRRLY
jgi:hypothetical protein